MKSKMIGLFALSMLAAGSAHANANLYVCSNDAGDQVFVQLPVDQDGNDSFEVTVVAGNSDQALAGGWSYTFLEDGCDGSAPCTAILTAVTTQGQNQYQMLQIPGQVALAIANAKGPDAVVAASNAQPGMSISYETHTASGQQTGSVSLPFCQVQ